MDAATGGAPSAPTASTSSSSAPDRRPNIVFVLTDDLDEVTSRAWDDPTPGDPTWDAPLAWTRDHLKNRGMTFEHAAAPTPICCAARATILTGRYGHNTQVLTNGGPYGGRASFKEHGAEADTMAVWLQNAGYRTMIVGKYMNGYHYEESPSGRLPPTPPPGWSEWHLSADADLHTYWGYDYTLDENGTLVDYGFADSEYSTDVFRDKAVDFIERMQSPDPDANEPFFMYVAPTAPHLPLPPARRHRWNPYNDDLAPRGPNYNEPDISDKPRWLRLTGRKRAAAVAAWNDVDYRNRMGSLYAVDEMVKAIVEALTAAGELDNTYIIFTSDNGYNLGAHRLLHKMAPYEESLRVPLFFFGPGIAPGTTERRQALHLDLAPTIADLAGVPPSSRVDGRSLMPLLRASPASEWRHDFLVQYHGGDGIDGIGSELPEELMWLLLGEIPSYRALWTRSEGLAGSPQEYLYVEWHNDMEPDAYHDYELYDLVGDRLELSNLLATARGWRENRERVEAFSARLDQLGTCAGDSCRE